MHTNPDIHIEDMTKYQLVQHMRVHHRTSPEISAAITGYLFTVERTKADLTRYHQQLHTKLEKENE